jgi:hypothetical protein
LSTASSSEPGSPLFPLGLTSVGLLAVVIGRALAQALPGSIAGYDGLVSLCLTFGAFCSQFFAVVGATLAIRAALWLALQNQPTLSGRAGWLRKVTSTAGKAALGCGALFVCAVVFVAAQPRVVTFGPVVLSLLSFGMAVLLGISASSALEPRNTRALSLIAAHAATAGLLHTLARLVAYQASTDGSLVQFEVARGLSTCAAIVECLLVAVSSVWLWRNSGSFTRALTSVLVLCAPAVTWNTPESGVRLALVRSIEQLCPHPDPFLPTALRLSLEVVVLALACGAVVNTKGPRMSGLVVCFALLGRSSGDTPLGALLLLLASLALLVLVALETSPVPSASTHAISQPPTTSSVHV